MNGMTNKEDNNISKKLSDVISLHSISPYIPSALFFQNCFNDLDPTKKLSIISNMDTMHLYFNEFVHVGYMHYSNRYVLS